MANPQNPLDFFVTYTYHFELHASNTWSDLENIPEEGVNLATEDRSSLGTLLINTRKDAHQMIDNVRYRYNNPSVDPTAAMHALSDLSMEIIEPNGTFFIEKLQKHAEQYQVRDITGGMVFGLKVLFVGRLEDGSEYTMALAPIIPLQLGTLSSHYTHRGGQHHLMFYGSANSAITASPLHPYNTLARAVGYTNKNITFKAKTVQEAIPLLESGLNKVYNDVYATEIENCAGARTIKYKVTLDDKIKGDITLVTKADSYAKDEKIHLTFTPNMSISSMIWSILTSSKDVNEMIASSMDHIETAGHPGVRWPIIKTQYQLNSSSVDVKYDIVLYEGGGDTFEFDYFFSEPGKNVDVLDFDVKFPNMQLWLTSTLVGTEINRNANSDVPESHPDIYSKNIVHEDTTREKLFISPQDKKCINALPGDVAYIPAVNRSDNTGFVRHAADAVPAAKLAFTTLAQASSAISTQVSFTIRGHLDLLKTGVSHPNDAVTGFGIDAGLWTKVNIFNQDGTPFFFTGKYRVQTIDNIFQDGKFLQILTCMITK